MSRTSPFMVAALGATTLVALGCSNDSTDPTGRGPVSSGIVIASGDRQVGVMAGSLGEPLTVKVTDLTGAALPGAPVTFAVTSGGGRVGASTAISDEYGLASTTWTLGSGADAFGQSVTATAAGHTVRFAASATVLVTKISGDSQVGEPTETLAQPPTVLVRDALSNPVPGVPVSWSILSGGGVVSIRQTTADTAGHASTSWTLGPSVGADAQSLQAVVGPSAPITYTASAMLVSGTLSLVSGNNQTTVAGWRLPGLPTVRVTNGQGAGVPVAGVEVRWQVVAGGGHVIDTSSTTDESGVAKTEWILGGAVGANAQQLRASVPGLEAPAVDFVASTTPAPFTIVKVSGDNQTGVARTELPLPLVVRVIDVLGVPVPGVVVYWWGLRGVLWGEGTPSSTSSTTDLSGQASVAYTLGDWAGSGPEEAASIAAACEGLPRSCMNPTASFSATTLAGPPNDVSRYSGNLQVGVVGTTIAAPISVFVEDAFGNPIQGVTVDWAADGGSGVTEVATSVSDAHGIASTHWTIGTTVGTNNQTATATVAGLAGSPVTFTASATAGP